MAEIGEKGLRYIFHGQHLTNPESIIRAWNEAFDNAVKCGKYTAKQKPTILDDLQSGWRSMGSLTLTEIDYIARVIDEAVALEINTSK